MLQQDEPDDFVIATGVTHSVEECCAAAFGAVDLSWRDYVRQDPALLRPAEVDHLVGDATKAERQLGWKAKTSFEELMAMMVAADLELVRSGAGFVGAR